MWQTYISQTPKVSPVLAPHFIGVNQLIERCTGVQSVGADDDCYGSVWTACTAPQLSENVGESVGEAHTHPQLQARTDSQPLCSSARQTQPVISQTRPSYPHSHSRHPLPAAPSFHQLLHPVSGEQLLSKSLVFPGVICCVCVCPLQPEPLLSYNPCVFMCLTNMLCSADSSEQSSYSVNENNHHVQTMYNVEEGINCHTQTASQQPCATLL